LINIYYLTTISVKKCQKHMMLGIIKRNFHGALVLLKKCLLNLHKTMVRPHLEYANEVWLPRRIQDMEKIEKLRSSKESNEDNYWQEKCIV